MAEIVIRDLEVGQEAKAMAFGGDYAIKGNNTSFICTLTCPIVMLGLSFVRNKDNSGVLDSKKRVRKFTLSTVQDIEESFEDI